MKASFFTNSKGKPSPSVVVGFSGAVIACLVFLICGVSLITKFNDGPNVQSLAMHSVALFTVASSLLGIRRFTQDKPIENGQSNTTEN